MTAPLVPVIRTDTSQVQAFFTSIDQTMSKVAAVALNRTGELAMYEQRKKMEDGRFTVRNPQFDVPPVTIPGPFRATPDKLATTVALFYATNDPRSIGSRAQRVFAKFQVAQTVEASNASQGIPFFQPTPTLRPNKSAVLPRTVYPRNLIGLFDAAGNFQGMGRTHRSTLRFKRRKGSSDIEVHRALVRVSVGGKDVSVFVLGQPGQRSYGIYAYFGPRDIRMIWHFVQQQKVPKKLEGFEDAMRQSFAAHWPDEMARALDGLWKGAIK